MNLQKLLIFVASVTTLFLLSVSSTSAYYTNMSASVVVGKPNFTTTNNVDGVNATTKTNAVASLVVGNKLLTADFGANRILIFNNIPTTNGAPANVVIGQVDFTSSSANQGGSAAANTINTPGFLASDGQKLFVVDTLNNRVLIFNSIPTTNNASADVVVGQTTFSGVGTGSTSSTFNTPRGVAVYNGKLIVSDETNSRVMIWNSIPTTNGVAADVILSRADASSTFSAPFQVTVSETGKLVLADRARNRVLLWDSVPTVNDTFPNVVVGQPDFSTISSAAGATKMNNPRGAMIDGNRLYVSDRNNNRVLIYNSVPTTNGAPADIVLGQTNFESSSANGGGSVSAKGFSGPFGVFVHQNQLFVEEFSTNSRLIIFDNTLATPEIQVGGTEPAPGGKIQMNGNVVLGNTNFYSLSRIQASVNGSGYSDVTNVGTAQNIGSGSNGSGQTYYPFYHQFEPWMNNDPRESWEDRGYTVKFKTVNSNAEENYQFYMNPLTLNSAASTSVPTLKFTVPKTQWDRIKENISGFSVLVAPVVKNNTNLVWTNYSNTIPTDKVSFDSATGVVTLTAYPKLGLSIAKGKYHIKVVANDKWGHNQESNSLETTLIDVVGNAQPYNPLGLSVVENHTWFPLQVNKITGVNTGGIITTNNLNGIKSTYTSNTTKPTFTGIAYTGATVAMNVTDQKTNTTKTYLTQATDSTWTITPTLTSNSVVNISVYNQNSWYNELLPLVMNVVTN